MNVVIIKWKKDQREATYEAIEMAHWLKEQGLTLSVDFDWFFRSNFKETEFRFYGEDGMATMFSLRFVQ